MKIKKEIEELFTKIRKPLTYIASEENAVFKSKNSLQICLIYPDLYELGIASLGINILYSVLNRKKDIWAQRAYMPDSDMLQELEAAELPLFSLEEQRPLNKFDIIGFSLPHELCYSNVLAILKAAHIPIRSKKRKESDPIVIAGGHGVYNPLSLASFIDAFVIGDGEEVVLEIAEKGGSNLQCHPEEAEGRREDLPRIKKLQALSEIEGVWVPERGKRRDLPASLNSSQRRQAGVGGESGQKSIKKRLVKNIDTVEYKPLVPTTKGENRLVVELMRGCTEGCRFCQAGFINRPFREKEVGLVFKEAVEGITNCGLNSISLLSLNTSDYSQVKSLVYSLAANLSPKKIAISLPSLRLDDFSVDILKQIDSVKKTGLTFAIEAGSQRLRNLINKRLTEEQILDTLGKVFASGWNRIKLYFMVGLPTETYEDLEEIIALLKKVASIAKANLDKSLVKKLKIVVGVSNFVPKPHTPFQWVAQDSVSELKKKHRFLLNKIKGPVFKLRWHSPEQSAIEGLLARGDYKTADVLEKAFELGALFDSFSERFDFSIWQKALKEVGLNGYLKSRPLSKKLPWDFIDIGVDKEFLKVEHKRSLQGVETADCRFDKCPKCGLCDKEVKNRFSTKASALTGTSLKGTPLLSRGHPSFGEVSPSGRDVPTQSPVPSGALPPCHPSAETVKYRLFLKKEGMHKYLSHLEWIAWIERRLRSTGLSLVMRGKYNPRLKLSFSQALPVGAASKEVFVDFQVFGSYSKKELETKLKESFSDAFIDCILNDGTYKGKQSLPEEIERWGHS